MKFLNYFLSLGLIFGFSVFMLSCSEDDPAPIPVVSTTFSDLDADYAPFDFSVPPTAGPPPRIGETGLYTLFSFATGEIVPNSELATPNWDIGFRSTSIIFNSGTSGSGTTTGQVIQGIFDEIAEAPEEGFTSDNGATFVISPNPKTGTEVANFWWQNGGAAQSTIVSPIAGQVIIVKTAANRYAKMEILNYYKGAPAMPNNMTDLDRHYKFRYVYQPNDSRIFE